MTLNSPHPKGARSACARMFSLWLVLTSVAGCTWQPIARDVEPVLIIPGPARIDRMIIEDHYALIEIGEQPPYALHILQVDSREHCVLPPGSIVPEGGLTLLTAPSLRGDAARAFLLPLFKFDGEQLNVYYADEKCELRGPFIESDNGDFIGGLSLRSDGRNVSLVRDPQGTLHLVDPWTRTVNKLADHVETYDAVQRSDASNAPEALWILENKKLTQRALDGTLLLSIGSDVAAPPPKIAVPPRDDDVYFGPPFAQTLRDQLRVAYVDNDNLYEAKGPDFTPVLLAEGACNPLYRDNALDLWLPCADRQLVRIDLQNGMIRRFAPQVYYSFATADVTLDLAYENPDDLNDWSMYAADGIAGTAPRVKLEPRPAGLNVNVLSGKRLATLSATAQLGIWTLDGKFTAGYRGVVRSQTFRDQRTGQLLWLIAYALTDDLATLGVVEQRQLEGVVSSIQADAGVPGTSDAAVSAARPLVVSERTHWRGYNSFYPPVPDSPVILSLEPPITYTDDAGTFTGSLNAHLLSAELSSKIDDGVDPSFQIVKVPLPGILYGILQGPRAGLWFAAL